MKRPSQVPGEGWLLPPALRVQRLWSVSQKPTSGVAATQKIKTLEKNPPGQHALATQTGGDPQFTEEALIHRAEKGLCVQCVRLPLQGNASAQEAPGTNLFPFLRSPLGTTARSGGGWQMPLIPALRAEAEAGAADL